MNTNPTDCHASGADISYGFRRPPYCAVNRFISQRVGIAGKASSCRCVGIAGSHGPAKAALPISAGTTSNTIIIKTVHVPKSVKDGS